MYSVAFVGTGADPEHPTSEGFAMAYRHADGYEHLENCRLVACADVVTENAEAFAAEHKISNSNIYSDYKDLIRENEPDIVSVCVPPEVHAEIVIGCAESGIVSAIHCEKPMARTWSECQRMVQVCENAGVQLTINHQRRFSPQWERANHLLETGKIGDLTRVEMAAPNLYDWGTHSFDLCSCFNNEVAPEWVLGQIDYRKENRFFGAHNENQAVAHWQYKNGVFGFAVTGENGVEMLDCLHRLIGTNGEIEVRGIQHDLPALRIRRASDSRWQTVEYPERDHDHVADAIRNIVMSLEENRISELSGRTALEGTKLIFGVWESARRRGRVDFPLEIDDNPLEAMVDAGDLTPKSHN